MAKSKVTRRDELKSRGDRRNSRSTVSGPARASSSHSPDDLEAKLTGTNELASRMPFNANKPREYDATAAVAPSPGQSVDPPDPVVTASTVTEKNGSEKVGSGGPTIGNNKTAPCRGSASTPSGSSTARANRTS